MDTITIKGGGGQEMNVYVVKANANATNDSMIGIINMHGGGGYMLNAKLEQSFTSRLATRGDYVFFNVEYRLAPETKTPGQFEDAVAAVKYDHENDN